MDNLNIWGANRMRFKLTIKRWLAACLVLLPSSGYPDLGATIDALRNEPMSLFDWGMYRLERELEQVLRRDGEFLRVFYDPDHSRITINASFAVDVSEIEAISAKTACYTRLHAIKLHLGVIDTNAINLAPAADYRLGIKFSHQDPETLAAGTDPEIVGRELLDSIFINVSISHEIMEFPFSPAMRCNGYLMQSEVHYHGAGDAR